MDFDIFEKLPCLTNFRVYIPGDAIPPGSTLVFEVELIQTADGPVPPNVFKQIDSDNDGALTHDEVSSQVHRT